MLFMVEVELTHDVDERYKKECSYLFTDSSGGSGFFLADSRARATEIAVKILRYDGAKRARYFSIIDDGGYETAI